ncbi:DNA-binding transcriptional regulator, AcrR family [Sinosporangium album]|uniref:DNA-binding transcriptional regulator, AcrR family n=1 Tax=Sinosporangium album TaxID=504805 RepID=A0A1G7RTF1_9ACTN|nr:TetR/AcrR family transcriptional regulator [Sinosporangium album]SDG14038.1 DNA-binding transcriptional regulator, AcrR family [Sinosporangium album]
MSPRQSDTRQRLLDEFAAQLLERGYPGISLNEIAQAIGIRKASLYHHFPEGKESLFAEVSLRYIDDAHAVLRRALDTPGGLPYQLSAIVAGYAGDAYRSAMGMRIYDSTRYVGEDTRTRISSRYVNALITPVTDLMADAIERGELRPGDPSFLAAAFLELAAVAEPLPPDVAMPPGQRADPTPHHDLVPAVVDLFLRGASS